MGLITPQGEVLQQGWAYLQPGEHFEFTQWTLKFVVRVSSDVCAYRTDDTLRPDYTVSDATVNVTLKSWASGGQKVVFWNSLVLQGEKDPGSGFPDGILTLELSAQKLGSHGHIQFTLYFQKSMDAQEAVG